MKIRYSIYIHGSENTFKNHLSEFLTCEFRRLSGRQWWTRQGSLGSGTSVSWRLSRNRRRDGPWGWWTWVWSCKNISFTITNVKWSLFGNISHKNSFRRRIWSEWQWRLNDTSRRCPHRLLEKDIFWILSENIKQLLLWENRNKESLINFSINNSFIKLNIFCYCRPMSTFFHLDIQCQAKWIAYFYYIKLGNSFCLAL